MPGVSALPLLLGAAGLWQAAESKAHFGFDCESGYAHWHVAWSAEKKSWCCGYVERGCPGDRKGAEGVFDCHDGFIGNRWMRGWSHMKKDWCCENAKAWSNRHQPFCCARHKGCHKAVESAEKGAGSTTEEPDKFYCLDKAAWTDEKRDWCCQHKEQRCPLQHEVDEIDKAQTERVVANVVSGYTAEECGQGDRGLWDSQKTCDCCQHYGIACPRVYYPPDIPDHVLICDLARGYETGAGKTVDISKLGPSLGKAAAGGALGFLLGAAALVVVRRRFRRAAGGQGQGYAAMPGQQTDFLLTEAGVQESKALDEELS